jgi:hypothetical protein
MTAQRKIEPELRNIPLTYLDCDIRHSMGSLYGEWFMCEKKVGDCGWLRENGLCPRGFP